jgi:hypothetical protein
MSSLDLQPLQNLEGECILGQRIWYNLTEHITEIHENIFLSLLRQHMQPHFTLFLTYHNMQHKFMFLCISLRINKETILLTSADNSEYQHCSLANEGHKSNWNNQVTCMDRVTANIKLQLPLIGVRFVGAPAISGISWSACILCHGISTSFLSCTTVERGV